MNVRRRNQLSTSLYHVRNIYKIEFKYQLREIGIVEYNVKNIGTCGNNDQELRFSLFSFLRRTKLEGRI